MRRKNANRNKTLILAAAAVVILALILLVVWLKAFVVRSVVIEGGAELSHEEIVRASRIDFGGHITRVDETELRSNLEGTGKYALDGVQIRYPGTVILNVRQRTRDAIVLCGGYYLVMDSDGCAIEALKVLPEEGGVYVYGLNATGYRIGNRISASEEGLDAMKSVLDAAKAFGGIQYISDLNVEKVDEIWATTRTGIRVEFGNVENMEEKVRWLCSAVSDLESRGQSRGTLDVSSGSMADYKP